jgi:NAD(P)H dehydrogenase (quinone)
MENLFMALPAALASGKWFTSSGDGRIPYITREDCARAAAAALASDRSTNARYDITGAQAYTRAEIAALVSQISGKPLEVVQVSDEQLAQGLTAAGIPAGFVPMLVSFDTNTRLGKFDLVSEDVRKLTGQAPQSLRDFLLANKAVLQ